MSFQDRKRRCRNPIATTRTEEPGLACANELSGRMTFEDVWRNVEIHLRDVSTGKDKKTKRKMRVCTVAETTAPIELF